MSTVIRQSLFAFLALLPLVASQPHSMATVSSAILDTIFQDPESVTVTTVPSPPKTAARRMFTVRQKSENAEQMVKTDYFDPKTYTTKDLPKLLDGFGQQISRDLDQAHSWLLQHAEKVRQLQYRIASLEQNQANSNAPAYLTYLIITLVLFLAVLLLFGIAIKCKQGRAKHVRLINPVIKSPEEVDV